jgi:hypothetical protein
VSNTTNCGCTETQETTYICNECQSTAPCECAVRDLSTDCVLYTGDTIQCQNTNVVVENTNVTTAFRNFSDFFCQKMAELQGYLKIKNIGSGAKIYKGDNLLGQKELRTITSSNASVAITEGQNTIDLAVSNSTVQNNYVRQLLVDINYLPLNYFEQDIVDYILTLPTAERTILETDSKWNILVGYPDEDDFDIKKVYEIQNIGKGIITTLEKENLLLINRTNIGLEEVIQNNNTLKNTNTITVNQILRVEADDNIFEIRDETYATNSIPSISLGRGRSNTTTETGLDFYANRTEFVDGKNSKGIEYKGDYEANFTSKSLVTKQYVDSLNPQKVITTNYTLTNADFGYTIFVNSASPITITLNTTVTTPNFYVGFIQEGAGEVTFVGTGVTLTNPIGLKSKGVGYQTFIERKLGTSTFYLMGNTKA